MLLVGGTPIMRAGLRAVLEGFSKVEILGDSDSVEEALIQADGAAPDTAFVTGDGLVPRLQSALPGLRILLFGSDADAARVEEALTAGVRGYLLGTDPPGQIRHALTCVLQGGRYVSPRFTVQPTE